MKLKIAPFLLSFALSGFAQSTNASVNVRAWGDNTYGQTNVPPDLTNAVAVSAGDYHCLALRTDGSVVAWGYGGDGRTTIPANATNVVAISAGAYHSLALRADGTVLGWGANDLYGQATGVPYGPPGIITMGGQILSNVVAIAAGTYNSLALKTDGTVVGWGWVNVANTPAVTNVVAITTYYQHAFAIKADGTVLSWGYNDSGMLNVPPNATNIAAISTSLNFTLALMADGTVLGWGANGGGQITVPANATNVIAVAAGRDSWTGDTGGYSLALKADGSLVGWGNAYVPPDMPLARAISAGYHFGLALVDPAQGATPPTILRQPNSHTVPIGSNVQLSVQALGFAPLAYQWYFGTNALPGQTNHSLSLVNLSASQSGVYVVVVSNFVGATTSQPVFVNVLPGLNINMVPAITMFGEVGRTYRLDYINVVGPTNDWRTVATVTLANNPQFYFDVSAIGQPARFYRLVQVP